MRNISMISMPAIDSGLIKSFAKTDIVAIFVAIIVLDVSGLFSVPLLDVLPHPFWIPVVLAATLYGTGSGVFAAAVAIALDWISGWSEIAGYHDYYAYLLNNLREPIQWLIAAGLLGQIRQRHIDEAVALRDEIGERRTQAQALAQQARSLRDEIARLEHTVAVSGGGSVGRTIELLDGLAAADPHQLEETFCSTLQRLLGAEGISVLVLKRRNGGRVVGSGKTQQGADTTPDNISTAILDALVSEHRVLACRRSADADVLAGSAAMAAPIHGHDGRVLAVVLIREVDPACLVPAAEAALSLSCFILGRRMSGAKDEAPTAQVIHDVRPGFVPARIPALQQARGGKP
jgi:hypothetical protein